MAIELERDVKERAIASIKQYFAERLDQDIGELKADLLLDFFLREIGPSVYNQAVLDAQAYFQNKTADLDGSCWQPEFTYWQ